MEYAPYTAGSGVMPDHDMFEKLGEYSAMRLGRGDGSLWMSATAGSTVKINRIEDPSVEGYSVFQAATVKAAVVFGTKAILVRGILTKCVAVAGFIKFDGEDVVVMDKNNTLRVHIVGSITGDKILDLSPDSNVTAHGLNKIVSRALVGLNLASKCTHIKFTNDEMINVNANTRIKNIFKVVTVMRMDGHNATANEAKIIKTTKKNVIKTMLKK